MYSFAAVEQEDTPATYSNSPSLGVSYELHTCGCDVDDRERSPLHRVLQRARPGGIYAHPGWRRQWTPNLTTSLAAGPQLIDEEVHPTVIASSSYQLTRELLASLTYSYGTGLVVGDAGAQQTSSLSGSLSYRPRPELEILVSGSWTKSFPIGASFDEGTDWFFAALTARYQFTKWLSAHLGYQFSLSDSASGESIPDNQLVVGVTFSYPFPSDPGLCGTACGRQRLVEGRCSRLSSRRCIRRDNVITVGGRRVLKTTLNIAECQSAARPISPCEE